ncbi:MAG TPA: 2-amino-4-hydroxy-6-hydroxymethyldihydropteridine diphosphokinase [Myxococcota bacterium]|nr:2-amino-4-hydroxy-6-hydroxymethyldihydropteridine diphosphokinase [Myxococcota bacterium]
MTRAYVALGANLGDRAGALARAIESLRATPGVRVVAQSSVWETPPLGPPQPDYLNAAVALDTELDALALLRRLHEIEAGAGRTRGPERNQPRPLDLDLLLFGGLVIDAPELTIPHPRMHERVFVLGPLAEIAPDEIHPVLHETIATLAARVGESDD